MDILTSLIVGIVAGAAAGALCAWFALRGRRQAREQEAALALAAAEQRANAERERTDTERLRAEHVAAERLREAERRAAAEATAARVPELESQLAAAQSTASEQAARIAEIEARAEEERRAAAEKLSLFAEAEQKLTQCFQSLSAEALRSNNQTFLELAKTTLGTFQTEAKSDLESRQNAVDALVAPLRESLAKVDSKLGEFGVNEKVIPATPTTLIALLRAVAYGWRQEALAENAQEVADLGRQLYERIATLAGHWSEVGGRLDKAVDAYNKSVATLESRVLVSARRLKDLKAAPEGVEIEAIEPVERVARGLQAVEFIPASVETGG